MVEVCILYEMVFFSILNEATVFWFQCCKNRCHVMTVRILRGISRNECEDFTRPQSLKLIVQAREHKCKSINCSFAVTNATYSYYSSSLYY